MSNKRKKQNAVIIRGVHDALIKHFEISPLEVDLLSGFGRQITVPLGLKSRYLMCYFYVLPIEDLKSKKDDILPYTSHAFGLRQEFLCMNPATLELLLSVDATRWTPFLSSNYGAVIQDNSFCYAGQNYSLGPKNNVLSITSALQDNPIRPGQLSLTYNPINAVCVFWLHFAESLRETAYVDEPDVQFIKGFTVWASLAGASVAKDVRKIVKSFYETTMKMRVRD